MSFSPFLILLALFFGSGCAALIYEIVWLQLLELVIGSTGVSLGIVAWPSIHRAHSQDVGAVIDSTGDAADGIGHCRYLLHGELLGLDDPVVLHHLDLVVTHRPAIGLADVELGG